MLYIFPTSFKFSAKCIGQQTSNAKQWQTARPELFYIFGSRDAPLTRDGDVAARTADPPIHRSSEPPLAADSLSS